jgi:hypothetical protein
MCERPTFLSGWSASDEFELLPSRAAPFTSMPGAGLHEFPALCGYADQAPARSEAAGKAHGAAGGSAELVEQSPQSDAAAAWKKPIGCAYQLQRRWSFCAAHEDLSEWPLGVRLVGHF